MNNDIFTDSDIIDSTTTDDIFTDSDIIESATGGNNDIFTDSDIIDSTDDNIFIDSDIIESATGGDTDVMSDLRSRSEPRERYENVSNASIEDKSKSINKYEILDKLSTDSLKNKVLVPLSSGMNSGSDCSNPNAKIAQSCLPDDKQASVLKVIGAGNMDEAMKKTNCDSERCIISKTLPSLNKYFKPSGPANVTNWLSNSHIDSVIAGWAVNDSKLYHIPFHMSNIYGIRSQLSQLDWKSILPIYNILACPINTDVYGGRGKHWVCVLVDARSPLVSIEYFDSGGSSPQPDVQKWMDNTKNELKTNGRESVIKTKMPRHQFSRTECGVYILYFLSCRIFHNISYEDFQKNQINDSYIMGARTTFFI
jgi:hypothetical protein